MPAYDLLEDRCTIDIIVSKVFPLCFKMVESFEKLHKEKIKNSLVEALNRYEEKKGERKSRFFLRK